MRRYIDEDQHTWDDSAATIITTITLAYNSAPHSSTGFFQFEFTVPKATNSLPLRREMTKSQVGYSTDRSQYRTALLQRVHEVSKLAKENLEEPQFWYKSAHDAHIKENCSIEVRDCVCVNTMYPEGGVFPKVAIPAHGPYEVRQVHNHNFKLATATGFVNVSFDRVMKETFPQDLSDPLTLFTRAKTGNERNQADDVQKFVVEYVVAHGEDENGKKIVRIRWHACEDSADTWEPVGEILNNFIQGYCSKKKTPLSKVLPEKVLDESVGHYQQQRQMLPLHQTQPLAQETALLPVGEHATRPEELQRVATGVNDYMERAIALIVNGL